MAQRAIRRAQKGSAQGSAHGKAGSEDPALQRHGRTGDRGAYSHSIVPGGLLVTSSTTRLTSATSLVIRVEIRASTS
ncbi:hypothetical protein ABH935_007943 [Catenulispora sp. GAS73]